MLWWTSMALAAEIVVGVHAPTPQAAMELAEAGDTIVLGPGQWQGMRQLGPDP